MLQVSISDRKSTAAAVPPGRDSEGRDVRRFGAFTGDLCALADWLRQCGIETVAMESTGVYWIALYELLVGLGSWGSWGQTSQQSLQSFDAAANRIWIFPPAMARRPRVVAPGLLYHVIVRGNQQRKNVS
jgi:hypothetical protein